MELEGQRVGQPNVIEAAEHARPRGERQVLEEPAVVLHHAKRAGDALGRQPGGPRSWTAGSAAVRSLVSGPMKPAIGRRAAGRARSPGRARRSPSSPSATPAAAAARRSGSRTRTGRCAVEEQRRAGRPAASLPTPGRRARAPRPQARTRAPSTGGVAGVPHVEVVVPVVGHRRGGAAPPAQRPVGRDGGERRGRLLSGCSRGQHRPLLQARPGDHPLGNVSGRQPGSPSTGSHQVIRLFSPKWSPRVRIMSAASSAPRRC